MRHQDIAQMVCGKDSFDPFFGQPVIGHPGAGVVDEAVECGIALADGVCHLADLAEQAEVAGVGIEVRIVVRMEDIPDSCFAFFIGAGDEEDFGSHAGEVAGGFEADAGVCACDYIGFLAHG